MTWDTGDGQMDGQTDGCRAPRRWPLHCPLESKYTYTHPQYTLVTQCRKHNYRQCTIGSLYIIIFIYILYVLFGVFTGEKKAAL